MSSILVPDAAVHFDAMYDVHCTQLCLCVCVFVVKTEMDRLSVYDKVIHQTKLRL